MRSYEQFTHNALLLRAKGASAQLYLCSKLGAFSLHDYTNPPLGLYPRSEAVRALESFGPKF